MQVKNTTNVKEILSFVQDYLKCKSFSELASCIGVKKNTLYSWVNRGSIGDTSAILDKCKGISLTYLQTGEGAPFLDTSPLENYGVGLSRIVDTTTPEQRNFDTPPYPHNEPHRIPVISWVQAGGWSDAEDSFHPGHADDWHITVETAHQNAFALVIHGDSMEPEFYENEIITIDPGKDPKNGDFIVAKNGNEATFKQLVIDGSSVFLKPLNSRYPIKDMTGLSFVIVGVVVEKRKKY